MPQDKNSDHTNSITKNKSELKKTTTVKPVVNAFRILRYMSEAREPTRLTHIARDLKINTSTCLNILRTLVDETVVDFNDMSKTYAIGEGMLSLVDSTLTEGLRLSGVRPTLHEIAERFSATATFWKNIGSDRITLAMVENSPTDFRIHMVEGHRRPKYMGASGRIFAAYSDLPEEKLHKIFKSMRWGGPLSFETYMKQVHEAKSLGYGVDNGTVSQGAVSVSAPIFDANGNVTYAIAVIMFMGQYDDKGIAKIGTTLKQYASRLTPMY